MDQPDVERARGIVRRLAAHAAGFQDVLDDTDRGPWASTVGADITALRAALDELAAPALPTPATGAQQPAPEERRERWEKALAPNALNVNAAVNAALAAADEERREQASATARQLGELTRELSGLRAELGQARGTTGQDVPAVGEQELRQQIRLACARAENVPVTILEPHDYQEHATAVLPVVQAAVAAGVRRALEDAAAELDGDARRLDHAVKSPVLNGAAYLLRCKAAVAPPAREKAYPERSLWEVQVLIPGRPWRTLSSGYEDLAAARERADAANDPFRDVRIVRATTTYTVEPTA